MFWSWPKFLTAALVVAALLGGALFYSGGLDLGRKALRVARAKIVGGSLFYSGGLDLGRKALHMAQAKADGCPLSLRELWTLNLANELDTEPYDFGEGPYKREFRRELSPQMESVKGKPAGADVYRYFASATKEVRVDASLPRPVLGMVDTAGQHPEVRMAVPGLKLGQHLLYYFEFDTSPAFDSPNFLQMPSLASTSGNHEDLADRLGMSFYLFSGRNRQDQAGPSVRLPFRVSSLALPLAYGSIGFADLAKFAQLAGYGLSGPELVEEMFTIVKYRYSWGSDSYMRCPLDTFASGVGECANVNDLFGSILEINGVRFRLVSGFNPAVRTVYPYGGHSAMEVLTPAGWEYTDPFLDIHLPGVPVRTISRTPQKDIFVNRLRAPAKADPSCVAFMRQECGPTLDLGELFRYRKYGDVAGRRRMAYMLSLDSEGEKAYGRVWPLRQLRLGEGLDPERDLPREFTVYVRGRYVLTNCKLQFRGKCQDKEALASPWATAQFQVRPLELLTR